MSKFALYFVHSRVTILLLLPTVREKDLIIKRKSLILPSEGVETVVKQVYKKVKIIPGGVGVITFDIR